MRSSTVFKREGFRDGIFSNMAGQMPRQLILGIILVLALFAFEMFNFDTTRFALQSLLGDVTFAGLAWATILAVAFCAIDFAGLARLLTPERGLDEPKEIWYLTGAWLLGATMNAIMTWWAVSVVILDNQLGNEVLSREQLLKIVPIFVALLVWLTRILFIGAITIAGERLIHGREANSSKSILQGSKSIRQTPVSHKNSQGRQSKVTPNGNYTAPLKQPVDLSSPPVEPITNNARVRQRPPRPIRSKPNRQQGSGNMSNPRKHQRS